jgi:LPXTG-motif cell wall-anchored protein
MATTTTTGPEVPVDEQADPDPTTTTDPPAVPGTLPRTGSDVMFAALFALSCLASGALLLIRRRRTWQKS